MSMSATIAAILKAAAVPLTAREIRKALGDTDTSEIVGGALSELDRRGKITVIRDQRPFTYVIGTERASSLNHRANATKPATATAKPDKAAPEATGSVRATVPIPPAALPTLADAEAVRQAKANDLRKSIDQHFDGVEALTPTDTVSIDRAHLRTLTYLAMHTLAPLDHDAYVAIVPA